MQRVLDPEQNKPWGNIPTQVKYILDSTEENLGVKILVAGGAIINDAFDIINHSSDVDCFVYSGDTQIVANYWKSKMPLFDYNLVAETENALTFEPKQMLPPIQLITKQFGSTPLDILNSFDINLSMVGATNAGYIVSPEFTDCLVSKEIKVRRFTENTSSRLIKYMCRFGITIRDGDLLKAINMIPNGKPWFEDKGDYAKL